MDWTLVIDKNVMFDKDPQGSPLTIFCVRRVPLYNRRVTRITANTFSDYCVGSAPGLDDVVQCMPAGNTSGCVMIENGKIKFTSEEWGEISFEISAFLEPNNGSVAMGSSFNMEPGKYDIVFISNDFNI